MSQSGNQDHSAPPALDEFALIRRFFADRCQRSETVVLGPGDDAAIVQPPLDRQLVMTQDTSLAGRHFPNDLPAFDIGYRCLAVNLSDLAAMGADPLWCLLSLTLPKVDEAWLQGFSDGLFSLAEESGIQLVGGDITRGELAVSIHATGSVRPGEALCRSGARRAERICLGGVPGEAMLGLQQWQAGARESAAIDRFARPAPQLALGQQLRGLASSCIDVSDGVLADLNHILTASGGLGATLQAEAFPANQGLFAALTAEAALQLQLQGGDDYLLLFTLPDNAPLPGNCLEIGRIDAEPGIRLQQADGNRVDLQVKGWKHF